jgi:hypothetical protein
MTAVARRSLAALTAGSLVVAVSCVTLIGLSVAAAAACSSFSAVAASQGVQLGIHHTGLLVGEDDVDAPAAQAAADSQGTSNAYAAEPYPGTDVMSVLPLAGLPTSTYAPLAQTTYPMHPHASVSAPGLLLKALSEETSSTASASGGADGGGGTGAGTLAATATAGCGADGTARARAESDDQAFSLDAGLLRIGRVHSLAQVVVGADGAPRLDSQLDIAQMAVAGQTVELSPQGLTIGGSSTALPLTASVAQALASAGITVTYLAPTSDKDGNGIVSPGVAITVARQAYGSQPTTVTYVLGESYDRAQGIGGGAASVSIPSSSPSPPAGSVNAASSRVPVTAALSGAPAASTGSTATPTLSGSPASGASSPGSPTASVPYLAAFSSEEIYLIVVVGAGVLLVALALVRILGVKIRWI